MENPPKLPSELGGPPVATAKTGRRLSSLSVIEQVLAAVIAAILIALGTSSALHVFDKKEITRLAHTVNVAGQPFQGAILIVDGKKCGVTDQYGYCAIPAISGSLRIMYQDGESLQIQNSTPDVWKYEIALPEGSAPVRLIVRHINTKTSVGR